MPGSLRKHNRALESNLKEKQKFKKGGAQLYSFAGASAFCSFCSCMHKINNKIIEIFSRHKIRYKTSEK
jgi:hypothetical protein